MGSQQAARANSPAKLAAKDKEESDKTISNRYRAVKPEMFAMKPRMSTQRLKRVESHESTQI